MKTQMFKVPKNDWLVVVKIPTAKKTMIFRYCMSYKDALGEARYQVKKWEGAVAQFFKVSYEFRDTLITSPLKKKVKGKPVKKAKGKKRA